ncbi:MAG: biotin--[acetyl-CoA-carboxylase] ligase [Myxococcales bacterium]
MIHRLMTCVSTNAEAGALAAAGAPAFTAVVADAQEGGRGRLGRAWYSPPGVNLYVSVILRPAVPVAVAPRLAIVAAVALAEAVEAVAPGLQVELKWPNDLLVGGRKAAGVLAELAGVDPLAVIVGVGVNANLAEIPPELSKRATSLALELGRPVDREALLQALLDRLRVGVSAFEGAGGMVDTGAWVRRARLDRVVRVGFPEGSVLATAVGLREDGALVVRAMDGRTLDVVAGDVVPVEWE